MYIHVCTRMKKMCHILDRHFLLILFCVYFFILCVIIYGSAQWCRYTPFGNNNLQFKKNLRMKNEVPFNFDVFFKLLT